MTADAENRSSTSVEPQPSRRLVESEAMAEAMSLGLNEAKVKALRLRDAISGAALKKKDAVRIDDLRPSLVDYILIDHPALTSDDVIARKSVDEFRARYISELLVNERGELSTLESDVVASLQTHDTLAENIEEDYDETRTLGDRVADKVASFGGSWTFIISFSVFLGIWMLVNGALGQNRAFDAYPFILLNLVLSTIAALQAPVIMMSQRRTEAKDRLRSLNEYKVNLKAELEIRHLHEKVDHLLNRQWERLTEIQQIQVEMMLEQARNSHRVVKVRPIVKRKTKTTKKAVKSESEVKSQGQALTEDWPTSPQALSEIQRNLP